MLREVHDSDIAVLFQHQLDPLASWQVAFTHVPAPHFGDPIAPRLKIVILLSSLKSWREPFTGPFPLK